MLYSTGVRNNRDSSGLGMYSLIGKGSSEHFSIKKRHDQLTIKKSIDKMRLSEESGYHQSYIALASKLNKLKNSKSTPKLPLLDLESVKPEPIKPSKQLCPFDKSTGRNLLPSDDNHLLQSPVFKMKSVSPPKPYPIRLMK